MTKEKRLSLLYFACASKQDLRLGFAYILHHSGEGPASTQPQSLQLLALFMTPSSQDKLIVFDTMPGGTYYWSGSCHMH